MSTAEKQVVLAVKVAPTKGEPIDGFGEQQTGLSLPARIGQLSVGQTCSESQFLDFDTTSRASFEQSVKTLRSIMSKAVARATGRTGNTYITVTGDHRTRDGDIIVVATAVRTV